MIYIFLVLFSFATGYFVGSRNPALKLANDVAKSVDELVKKKLRK